MAKVLKPFAGLGRMWCPGDEIDPDPKIVARLAAEGLITVSKAPYAGPEKTPPAKRAAKKPEGK